MGAMAAAMFLGISWLATHIPGITVSHERSVVAQVAHAVFGGGIGFYVVQAFTAAILILAANTAYQDFPRLSSILARDGFLPSQFKNRGDRLVFSNGVIVLAGARRPADLGVRRRPLAPDPALRRRRVHLVHALADRYGAPLAAGAAARRQRQGLATRDRDQRDRSRRRRASCSS